MNREKLKELGLTDEQIEQVMASHGATVNDMKDKLTTAESEINSYKTQLTERDTDLEKLKTKAAGNEEIQTELDNLKTNYSEQQTEHQKELQKTKLNYELDQALILSKARDPKVLRPLLDTETVKFDENGKLIGLSEQLENLKTSHDYLFVPEDDGTTPPPSDDYIPGPKKKLNPKKQTDPAEAGRLKAMERHGIKQEKNEEE